MSHLKSFVLLASLCLLATLIAPATAACASKDITPSNKTNLHCSWYNDNSCCEASDVLDLAITKLDTGCRIPPRGCQEQVVKLLCGLSCSPSYSDWYDKDTGKIRMCKGFADQIWSECHGASFKMQSSVGTMEFGRCTQLSHRFVSSQDLVVKGYGMQFEEDESMVAAGRCFNAGVKGSPPSLWLLGVVAVLLGLQF